MRPSSRLALPLLAVCAFAPQVRACGACGCTLNGDWASQGIATRPGFRFDLRYDAFTQDQLRSGTGAVARASLPLPNAQEIQGETVNRNLTLTLDYSPNARWGLTFQAPGYHRTHDSVAAGDTEASASQSTGLGDVRLVGRYQGFLEDFSLGVQAGLKLPTGRFHDAFAAGPQAGEPVDRGLQLGTGTTDLLLGVYKFGDLGGAWGYFGQAMVQFPLGSREDFRPGRAVNVNAGVRWAGLGPVTPQLQLNLRAEQRESGAAADVANSGATLVYLSPGLTANLGRGVQAYAFVQLPVHQRVNGLQLEPRSSVSVGLHVAF
jgi:hypothetical protein